MAKKTNKKTEKKSPKVAGKSKAKIKATKKLKVLVSEPHPVPETFLQKLYNKVAKCQRLLSVRDSVTEFYRSGIDKCKRLF